MIIQDVRQGEKKDQDAQNKNIQLFAFYLNFIANDNYDKDKEIMHLVCFLIKVCFLMKQKKSLIKKIRHTNLANLGPFWIAPWHKKLVWDKRAS